MINDLFLSGEEVARVVVNKLKELNIFHMIGAICFDTCAANTGWAKGTVANHSVYFTKPVAQIHMVSDSLALLNFISLDPPCRYGICFMHSNTHLSICVSVCPSVCLSVHPFV